MVLCYKGRLNIYLTLHNIHTYLQPWKEKQKCWLCLAKTDWVIREYYKKKNLTNHFKRNTCTPAHFLCYSIQCFSHVAARCIKPCRYRTQTLVYKSNIRTRKKLWEQTVALFQCQMGWFRYFRNCWQKQQSLEFKQNRVKNKTF